MIVHIGQEVKPEAGLLELRAHRMLYLFVQRRHFGVGWTFGSKGFDHRTGQAYGFSDLIWIRGELDV
jgi:hypothetical protein